MAAPDMEVIKEIPGYKVILKAVLKSQIQQLVEQLASHTDEETVVLTASISDGTLSHLGSDSGKSFLEDHEEMKSQFLGFCLKRHHKKSQEQALKQLEMQSASFPDPTSMGYTSHLSPGNQLGATRMGIETGNRQRGPRHEPYRRSRGRGIHHHSNRGRPTTNQNLTDSSLPLSFSETPERPSIKEEPDSFKNESSDQSYSETGVDNSVLESTHSFKPSTAHSEALDIPSGEPGSGPPADSQGLHTDLVATNPDQGNEQDSSSACEDNNVSIKQESGGDSDLDLQITGMEPGRSAPQDSWGANVSMSDVSMDMNYDPSGAMGSSHDMQAGQQGYRYQSPYVVPQNMSSRSASSVEDSMFHGDEVSLKCPNTGQEMTVKKYTCLKCDYYSFVRSNLKRHFKSKHQSYSQVYK